MIGWTSATGARNSDTACSPKPPNEVANPIHHCRSLSSRTSNVLLSYEGASTRRAARICSTLATAKQAAAPSAHGTAIATLVLLAITGTLVVALTSARACTIEPHFYTPQSARRRSGQAGTEGRGIGTRRDRPASPRRRRARDQRVLPPCHRDRGGAGARPRWRVHRGEPRSGAGGRRASGGTGGGCRPGGADLRSALCRLRHPGNCQGARCRVGSARSVQPDHCRA